MPKKPNIDWLQRSLLQLSPNVFFHDIWIDFVRTQASFSTYPIEELKQAAEQLKIGHEVDNACQIHLMCAALEARLGNFESALALIEKTIEIAQKHHLPQIGAWANWGATSLCARHEDWPRAIIYLQHLQTILNKQGDWMLASIISLFEGDLAHLADREGNARPNLVADFQLDTVLDQLFRWEKPLLTTETTLFQPDDDRPSSWRSFWQTVTGFFGGKSDSQPPGSTATPTPDILPASQPKQRLPPPQTPPKTKTSGPEQPTPARTMGKLFGAERMAPSQDRPLTPPQTITKSQSPSPIETEILTKAEPVIEPKPHSPSLTIYCLGPFRVYQDEKPITEWSSGKGKLIFKYLLTHRQRPVAKEVLMEQFWPDAHPDAARNNLNVAIYGLRQALRNGYENFSHVLFQDDHYLLNPELQIWVDFEVFLEIWHSARRQAEQGEIDEAIQSYYAASSLYQGEFLAEDRYEEWLLPQRQQLEEAYLNLLDQLSQYHFQNEGYAACIEACRHILVVEPCRESTHRRLMRCYCRQGQYYLGLRQYHQCAETLQNELEVAPSPQTTHLYEQIRHHELV